MSNRINLTTQQRVWVKNRDGNLCVLCKRKQPLHVHHISPYRFCLSVLKWSVCRINSPINCITLCENCHNGSFSNVDNCIHPDMVKARLSYKSDRHSYLKAFEVRNQLVKKGKTYWNTRYDDLLSLIALKNTIEYIRNGATLVEWPELC